MSKMIRTLLEQQANLIEATLLGCGISINICGGITSFRKIKYQIDCSKIDDAKASRLLEAIKQQRTTISKALGQPVEIGFTGTMITIEVPNVEQKSKVPTLFNVMQGAMPPKNTAVLGITNADEPLQVRLSSASAKNVLIVGDNQDDNSRLLRTVAVSLALSNTHKEVRLVCISPDGVAFNALTNTPHLVQPRIQAERTAVRTIESIIKTVRCKQEQKPRVIIMIDRVEMFPKIEIEKQLLDYNGLHWIVSTCDRQRFQDLARIFQLKLIGTQNPDIDYGTKYVNIFSGEYFALCNGGTPIVFTPAHIEEYEAKVEIGKANVQTNTTD